MNGPNQDIIPKEQPVTPPNVQTDDSIPYDGGSRHRSRHRHRRHRITNRKSRKMRKTRRKHRRRSSGRR